MSGGSFTNISNGGIYSGATTATLTLTGVTTSMNGNQYQCILTMGSCTTTTNDAALTVNGEPSLTITNPLAVCSPGTANITAAAVTAGSNLAGGGLSYWTDAGATHSLSNPSAISGSGTYYIKASTSPACYAIAPVTVTVSNNLPVSVSISPSANPICSGTPVTFTAAPTNGGSSPAYQWKVNGSNVGTNSTTYSSSSFNNNDAVTCLLTSSFACATGSPATSPTTTMTVNPNLPVSVSISPSANPICSGTSVTFTATPTNGGVTPSYQWKVNGSNVGTNSTTYNSSSFNNSDVVTCVLTSNATCATGSPATSSTTTMIVNPNLPVSVSIAPSANSICSGTSVTFTATPTNGGTTPSYQWKINGSNVGTNNTTYSSSSFNNNDAVTCVLTSNAMCATGSPATSSTTTMTVNPNLPVSVSISPSANPICSGTSVTFTATPTNGGTTPSYQWKVNGSNVGTNNITYSSSSFNNNDAVTLSLIHI